MLERVKTDPFLPVWWGKNQKGMQASEELTGDALGYARTAWLTARDNAVQMVEFMQEIDVHKQIANRLLEPFLWHTAIVSATDYGNFFAQRCDPLAQPEIRVVAEMMRDLYFAADIAPVDAGTWHLPYLDMDDLVACETCGKEHAMCYLDVAKRVSVARCARVSYLTQDGKRDVGEDINLFNRLTGGGHWSPFEHVAMVLSDSTQSGNFVGFEQFRKQFAGEMRTYELPKEAAIV